MGMNIKGLFGKSLISKLKYLHLERLQDLELQRFRLKSVLCHFLDL